MRVQLIVAVCALLSACGEAPAPSPASVDATSVVRISLPDDPAPAFSGAGAALIERNCTACHSSEMIATQPPLSAEKWAATVTKMREVYGARIAAADEPALVAALQQNARASAP